MSPGDPPVEHVAHGHHDHPDVNGGWLRPAVFGMMDGLVSNCALIAGVAGGTAGSESSDAVVLAGLAGLAAGAFSMAAGEYASVASQAEAAEREVREERAEIVRNPEAEIAELAQTYVARGVSPDLAAQVARQIHRNVDAAVSAHAHEELGVDPDDLASPTLAAGSSFLAFSVGALVPLVPFLLGRGALVASVALTLVALFVCGAVVTRVTSRAWWFGGLRQVVLGGAAFAATYFVGAGVGTQV